MVRSTKLDCLVLLCKLISAREGQHGKDDSIVIVCKMILAKYSSGGIVETELEQQVAQLLLEAVKTDKTANLDNFTGFQKRRHRFYSIGVYAGWLGKQRVERYFEDDRSSLNDANISVTQSYWLEEARLRHEVDWQIGDDDDDDESEDWLHQSILIDTHAWQFGTWWDHRESPIRTREYQRKADQRLTNLRSKDPRKYTFGHYIPTSFWKYNPPSRDVLLQHISRLDILCELLLTMNHEDMMKHLFYEPPNNMWRVLSSLKGKYIWTQCIDLEAFDYLYEMFKCIPIGELLVQNTLNSAKDIEQLHHLRMLVYFLKLKLITQPYLLPRLSIRMNVPAGFCEIVSSKSFK